jgi:CRISPR/Cas system endoribonuclease Cas6 (RAMP superfamily)
LDLLGEVNETLCENVLELVNRGEAAGDKEVRALLVRFVTPTELKVAGGLARLPEFPVLFARVRDRLRSLSTLYGMSIELDFKGLTESAASVALRPLELTWEKQTRTSRKTGQTHPLGGFLGQVRYEGNLAEFLPLLQAACWTGVGRQTVWGKGEMEVRTHSE